MKHRTNVFFDMDGTVADLYGRDGWLLELRSKVSPFKELAPLVDMEALDSYMKALKPRNFHFEIITWTPMEATHKFHTECANDKDLWATKYMNQIEDVTCLPYGTPKQDAENVNQSEVNILIDDNPEVIESWEADGHRGILVTEDFTALDALEMLFIESNKDLNLNFNF